MNKLVHQLIFLLLLVFQGNCFAQSIGLDGVTPLTLVIANDVSDSNTLTREVEISINSDEYQAFYNWLLAHRDGWQRGGRKWLAPYMVVTKGFHLKFSDTEAVLTLTEKGVQTRLSREVDEGLKGIFKAVIDSAKP